MEDKKPQDTSTNATVSKKVVRPTQTVQAKPSQHKAAKTVANPKQIVKAKPKQPISAKPAQPNVSAPSKPTVVAKPAQPKGSVPAKPKMAATVKPAQSKAGVQTQQTQTKSPPTKQRPSVPSKAQTANAKKRPQVWIKSDKASQTVKSQANQPTFQKAAPTDKVGSAKQKPATPQKAIKPTPNAANTEVKATGAKKSVFAKLISFFKKTSVTGAPTKDAKASKVVNDAKVEKAAKDAKAEKVAKESKPKLSLKAWLASKCKKKPKENTTPKKVKKAEPKEKTEAKETSAAVPADKRSTIAKLATKGFVVKSWQIAVAVAVVAALVVGGILLGTTLGNKNGKAEDPIVDYIGPIVDKDPENPSNITLPGYPVLMFPANSKKVTLELPNPKGNPCYFRYTLTIVETGDVLYKSARIDPGKMVKDLTLNHTLAVGTYTLRITIDTFSLDDGNAPMNGGVQEVKLIVK